MKKTIHMVFKVDTKTPFHKSSGIINNYLRETLEELGFDIHYFNKKRSAKDTHIEKLIPLEVVSKIHQISICEKPNITIYDDHGLSIQTPKSVEGNINILFFHGLKGSPQAVIQNKNIDIFCCNSHYLATALYSLMRFPDLDRKMILDNRSNVFHIRLPIPILDYPNGYFNEGSNLPNSIKIAIDQGYYIAHAVQRDKSSAHALISIMSNLNKQLQDKVINNDMEDSIRELMLKKGNDYDYDNLFISVPLLNNSALISLMKISSFGLCYNKYPDSFGIYPLESVFLGTPIYTNGIGNNRFLLPENHGIFVYETVKMARYGEDYDIVATDIISGLSSDIVTKACDKGREYIKNNHNRSTLKSDVSDLLMYAGKTIETVINTEKLKVTLSPLVRIWCFESSYVVSDYKNICLSFEENNLIHSLLGCYFHEIHLENKELFYSLFYKGILSLR